MKSKNKILPETAKLVGQIVEQSLLNEFQIGDLEVNPKWVYVSWHVGNNSMVTVNIENHGSKGILGFSNWWTDNDDDDDDETTIDPITLDAVMDYLNSHGRLQE